MKSFVAAVCLRASMFLLLTSFVFFSGNAQIADTTTYFLISSIGQGGKSIAFAKKDTSVALQTTVADDQAQLWKWSKGSGSYFRITNQQLGPDLYLSVFKVGDDYKLMFSPKKDQSGQLWYANTKAGSSRITCMWLGSGRLLEVTGDGKLMMTEILMGADAKTTQLWKLTSQGQKIIATKPTTSPEREAVVNKEKVGGAGRKNAANNQLDTAATYRIVTMEMPDKSLSIGTIDGRIEQAMLVPALNQSVQEWKLALNANGFYRITNRYYPAKSLEVRNDGASKDMVVINNTTSNKEQLWKIKLTLEGAYQISSPWQGDSKTLDFVEDGEEKNEIRLRDVNSTIWTFIAKPAALTVISQPVEKATIASNNKNRLVAGEQLKENAKLISANGEYSLVQQPDGNLVIYNTAKKAIWASGMNGKNVKRCVMQKDGNLAQHPGGYDQAQWSTNTKGNPGAYAQLQDDGLLVVINKENQIVWSSKN